MSSTPVTPPPVVAASAAPDVQTSPTVNNVLSGVVDPATVRTQPPAPPKQTFIEGAQSVNPRYRVTGTGDIETAQPARRTSAKGVLGRILMGALEGAESGLRAPVRIGGPNPAALGAAQAHADRLAADVKARNIAQQNFLNEQKQQESNRAQMAAMDEHQKALANISYLNTQTHVLATKLQQSEQSWPYLQAQEELNLQKSYMDATQQFDAMMAQINDAVGDAVDFSHGPQYGGVNKQHATAAAKGNDFHFLTGQHGDGVLGFGIADVDRIMNSPLKKDVEVTVPVLDPNTGEVSRKTIGHLKAGAPARDALAMVTAYYGQWTQAYTQYANLLNGQAKDAQTQELRAKAGLEEAQLQNLKQMGINLPDDWTPDPDAFKRNEGQTLQSLRSQGIKAPPQFPALWAVGHYLQDPNTFPNRPYNRPGEPAQMGKDMATSFIRTFINPNYDDKNYKAVEKMQVAFADPRNNDAGGMLIAFNTAIGHAYQLYQATDALRNNDLQGLNRIAQSLNVQTGKAAPQVFDAIRNALVGEVGKTFKGAAPDQVEMQEIGQTMSNVQSPAQAKGVIADAYAHLLKTKAGNLVNEYISYTGQLPPYSFSPDTVQALQAMGVDVSDLTQGATVALGSTGNTRPYTPRGVTQPQIPDGATMKVPGSDGKMHWSDGKKDLGVVQ